MGVVANTSTKEYNANCVKKDNCWPLQVMSSIILQARKKEPTHHTHLPPIQPKRSHAFVLGSLVIVLIIMLLLFYYPNPFLVLIFLFIALSLVYIITVLQY